MIIISSIALCAVVVFKEARGTQWEDQYRVASTTYNRAEETNSTVQQVIFKPHQFTSMKGIKPKTKFSSYKDMLAYYNIKDSDSYSTALIACGYADNVRDERLKYFHDKSINKFKWSESKPIIISRDFKFYN